MMEKSSQLPPGASLNVTPRADADKVSEFEVDMWWHMARYLPESRGLRAKFNTLLAGYLVATHRAILDESRRLIQVSANATESDEVLTDATLSPSVLNFLDRLIREQIGPELYNFVQRLRRKAGPWCPSGDDGSGFKPSDIVAYLDEKETASELPPLLPPHPVELADRDERVRLTPIGDFVKTLCRIFSLDVCIARQVGDMQRDLFRLLGVGEFSDDADWCPPHEFGNGASLLVHLPEVTCVVCNFVRDLDVCRDRYVAKLSDIEEGWVALCSHCGTPYSRTAIETGLLGQLEHFAKQFLLQVSWRHHLTASPLQYFLSIERFLSYRRIFVVLNVSPVVAYRSPP